MTGHELQVCKSDRQQTLLQLVLDADMGSWNHTYLYSRMDAYALDSCKFVACHCTFGSIQASVKNADPFSICKWEDMTASGVTLTARECEGPAAMRASCSTRNKNRICTHTQ